jgi:hypothetical protein
MAITTHIATHYGWKYLIMAVVCLVLGVWGVYDYVIKIPSQLQAHERGDTARAVRDALTPGATNEQWTTARQMVEEERARFAERYPQAASATPTLPTSEDEALELGREASAVVQSLRPEDHEPWASSLALFEQVLQGSPRPADTTLDGTVLYAYDVADHVIQQVAPINRPSFYDRPVQWMFILCLPFVPWCLWVYFSTKRRVYRLDDDGTLHFEPEAPGPAGKSWAMDDIADIDMSQWMRKSIAWVVHRDGTRVKLDDYKHKHLHLIIGAIASRLYPDEWDEEAKPVKKKPSQAGLDAEEPAEFDDDSHDPAQESTERT